MKVELLNELTETHVALSALADKVESIMRKYDPDEIEYEEYLAIQSGYQLLEDSIGTLRTAISIGSNNIQR